MPLGMLIDVILVQPENAPAPIEATVSGMVIADKPEHSAKAPLPIYVTVSGQSNCVRLSHLKKVISPICRNSLPIVTEVRLEQPWNVPVRLLTVVGRTIELILVQPENAHVPIYVTDSERLIDSKPVQAPKA